MTEALPTWPQEDLDLLYFIYHFWATERRPPNVGDMHAATGHSHRELRRILRHLQSGFGVALQDDRLQLPVLKAPPFSATATPNTCYVDGDFLSYLGCPAEVFTIGGLPMFEQKVLTVRSFCSCCFEPFELDVRGQDVVRVEPYEPIVAIVGSPWEWEEGVPPDRVCDVIHFVKDAEHAEEFGRQNVRRPVLLDLKQIAMNGRGMFTRRMRDPNWPPYRNNGHVIVEAFASYGVDVSLWR
jgi:Alkylmercury lyase